MIPKQLVVLKTSPENSATSTYSVIADCGWCERIMCSESYLDDANIIAKSLSEYYKCVALLGRPD